MREAQGQERRSMRGSERWIVAVVGGTLLVDSIFYTALIPLLPQFVHRLHMSAGAAGLLTACYAVGSLLGTVPTGLLADRIGARATVLCGLSLPAIVSGELSVLGSLRLHRLGAGPSAIGLTFLIAAGIEAGVGPWSGRASDRRGRLGPICLGLGAATLLLASFGLPGDTVAAAALVVGIAVAIEVLWAPAMAWLSEVLERRGDAAGLAGALINLAWAGGQIIGSAAGGRLAQATGDVPPMLATAALSLMTLLVLGTSALRGRGIPRRAEES